MPHDGSGREGGPAAGRPVTGLAAEHLWLVAALAFALVFAARTMAPAFRRADAVADDMRQYIVFLARYRDPELFADDPIADYYEWVSPPGYRALYWGLTRVADPLVASKLLPPVLGAVTALFTFLLVRRLHPAPSCAFLAAVLASWYFWQYEDLASATPRAFLAPLLAILLWSLAAGRTWLSVGVLVLTALLYPFGALLGVALLGVRLVGRRGRRPALTTRRRDWLAFLAAVALVGGALLPRQLDRSWFGPPVSSVQARAMREFGARGRIPFFAGDGYRYWIERRDSGLDLHVRDALFPRVPILFEYLAVAAVLPALVLFRRRLPAAGRLRGETVILPQLLVASLGLFSLAHLLLFQLYFPSRYVRTSLPLLLAVAAGLALGILIEAIGERCVPIRRRPAVGGLALGMALLLALYPARYFGQIRLDGHPRISAYLRAQPKSFLVAGPPDEVDSIPAFTGRRILASREHALPFHLGYNRATNQRVVDLINAYYAESASELAEFAARYGVDAMLVSREAFRPRSFREAWSGYSAPGAWEPYITLISRKLERPTGFALRELASRCAVVDDGRVAVVPASCLRGEGAREVAGPG